MADLSWLGAAGMPEPTSDMPPARPCGDTSPDGHAPHFWHTAGQRYFCPGIRRGYAGRQPQAVRSCHRRANHEPHPPHGWHPDGLDAPPAWCSGVKGLSQPESDEPFPTEPRVWPFRGLTLTDVSPSRLCFKSLPHYPHRWYGEPEHPEPTDPAEQVPYWCGGIPAGQLAASFRNPLGAERATAGHSWQGDENTIRDDLAAYVASGMPGLSNPGPPEVDLEPGIVARIRAVMARRPLVLVHDQATADALAGAGAELPDFGIALVVDEAIPAGTALVVDRAKLAETLNRWAAEQVIERPQLPLRLAAYPLAAVAEPGTIGWAALITGV